MNFSETTSDFFQEGPTLQNQYDHDLLLRSVLKRHLGDKILKSVEADLRKLGDRTIGEIFKLGREAEVNPPVHVPYDPWGKRIDYIEVSRAWVELGRIATEEKLVATAYERQWGDLSRLIQFAKVYLYNPSSAIYTCPLAMTDGAARAIEIYGDENLKKNVLPHLAASDVARAWTSGQWMTERAGGSDVGRTLTIAKRDGELYRLYGTKWFTSATTSEVAMTLARIEGAPSGSRGLSLFFVHLRDVDGCLNRISIQRLKEKMGTKALPTAELNLEGTPATLVGGEGDGVKKIASLFNITRVWNAITSVSFMRRGLALSLDYAGKREAFGKKLLDHPLHEATLADLEVQFQGNFHLAFFVARLLGKDELKTIGPEESAVLRLLIPVAKLFTAKCAIDVLSEVIESFGGAGYVEDTGLPALLRDTHVLSIWEGTTNVLSLDVLRAIHKEKVLEPACAYVVSMMQGLPGSANQPEAQKIMKAISDIKSVIHGVFSDELQEAMARRLAYSIAKTFIAALMLDHASWAERHNESHNFVVSARRWCSQILSDLEIPTHDRLAENRQLTSR